MRTNVCSDKYIHKKFYSHKNNNNYEKYHKIYIIQVIAFIFTRVTPNISFVLNL